MCCHKENKQAYFLYDSVFQTDKPEKTEQEEMQMTFSEFFAQVKERLSQADVSGLHENVAYQFDITGEAAGTFYVEVKKGKLSVEPYDYRDRDACFTCSADTLAKIADGKLDPVAAFTFRKLKIDGSIEKALRLKQLLK